MIFLRINQTVSFSTAHSASLTAQNWLDCATIEYAPFQSAVVLDFAGGQKRRKFFSRTW